MRLLSPLPPLEPPARWGCTACMHFHGVSLCRSTFASLLSLRGTLRMLRCTEGLEDSASLIQISGRHPRPHHCVLVLSYLEFCIACMWIGRRKLGLRPSLAAPRSCLLHHLPFTSPAQRRVLHSQGKQVTRRLPRNCFHSEAGGIPTG